MKKVVKKIIVIFLVILFIELIAYLFKNNHFIEYKINNFNKQFFIEETYKNDNYYFKINIDDNTWSFNYKNVFSKAKKVIKKIEYYKTDDMVCIFPILKNDNYLNIICEKENELYYYDYIKDKILDFTKNLIEKGYLVNSWNEESSYKKLGNSKVYTENIDENSYIYVWKYNGFYTINREEVNQLNIFSKDTYLNKLGIQIKKYYIIPNYDESYEYDKLYVLNMKNNDIKTIEFKENISSDYYNNGIVDNKLYIFDKDNLIQYKINPKRRKYEIVGNKEDGGLFYTNNNFEELNIYDFKKKEIIFEESRKKPEELKDYDIVYNNNTNYYYFDGFNYIVYNTVLKNKIYLFNMNDVNDLKFVDNDLYFIKDNTLYYYNIYNGLKNIMEYEELSFNKVNRYAIYKK